MKVYDVYHCYDEDGGFGDAIPQMELVATFTDKADAVAFVEKYSHPRVYDTPYDALYCNEFVARETELITHDEFNINKKPEDYGVFIPG